MGTWDTGSFDNDAALDFVASLESHKQIADKIRNDAKADEADTAAEVIAACDLVAAMLGRPAADMPEDVLPRLGAYPPPNDTLLVNAREAIAHLRKQSELASLWAEEDDTEWQAALDDLLIRLDPVKPFELPVPERTPNAAIVAHCFACEGAIPEDQAVDLVHIIDDGVIYSTMTLHAHRHCVEERFDPPHWNADGSPSEALLAQFAHYIGVDGP